MADPYAPLRRIRLGCVRYLNSRPLIHAYDGPVHFDHPSALARQLSEGGLDAALVPVFEILQHPGYLLADGVAIACDGPVFSVFLLHRTPLSAIRTVALDPASLTSVNLLRVLLAEAHHAYPQFLPSDSEADARLFIGNQAIEHRTTPARMEGWKLLDLGEAWHQHTGLPFVFAVWAIRSEIADAASIAEALRHLKEQGSSTIDTIVAQDPLATPTIRHRYLTEHIRYDLGAREKDAILHYRHLLHHYGMAVDVTAPLRWM